MAILTMVLGFVLGVGVALAQAPGLRYAPTMRHVVLPQAVRNMLPSLATQVIILVKDTSLVSIIGYMDLTKAAQTVNGRLLGAHLRNAARQPGARATDVGGRPRPRRPRGQPVSGRASGSWLPPRSSARLRARVLAIGLAIGLAGCTGALREDVTRQGAALSDLRTGVDGLRTDLRGIRDEVAGLRAALEVRLGQAAETREAEDAHARETQEALEARLATAERRVEEMADGVTGLEVAVATLAEQFARLEAGSASAATLPRTRPYRPRQTGPPISAEELFDRGMESFRAGELGQSVLDFEEFAEKHSAHPLAASAQFWIGEAYFRSRDFEQAASKYQKAIDLAATGERTPDALLRLGLAFRSLRREDRARDVWARLLRDFPDSEAALRARAVLRQPGRAVRPAEPR